MENYSKPIRWQLLSTEDVGVNPLTNQQTDVLTVLESVCAHDCVRVLPWLELLCAPGCCMRDPFFLHVFAIYFVWISSFPYLVILIIIIKLVYLREDTARCGAQTYKLNSTLVVMFYENACGFVCPHGVVHLIFFFCVGRFSHKDLELHPSKSLYLRPQVCLIC